MARFPGRCPTKCFTRFQAQYRSGVVTPWIGRTTTAGRLLLTVCQRLEQEATAAIEREGLEGVTIASFPGECDTFLAGIKALASSIPTDLNEGMDDLVCCIGGPCFAGVDFPQQQAERLRIHRIDRRFQISCDQKLESDSFARALARVVLESQLELERIRSRRATSRMNRQIADYAMAYNLMARLAAVMNEAEAIENILELCATLFAPRSLHYVSVGDGRVESLLSWPTPLSNGERSVNQETGHPSIGAKDNSQLVESPGGFTLPIVHKGETLGAVHVDEIAYPEYREHYLNLGLAIASVCGLAIANARTYDKMKQTEEALAAERERLRVTLQSIGDGVIATDTEGRVVMINRVAEQLTGWTQDEARARPLTEIFNIINEQTRAVTENPVAKTLATGQVMGLANHTALIARDGTERSIADSAAPIRDETGAILGVVLVFRDVTASKWAEQERERMLGEVRQLAAEAEQRAVELDVVNKELDAFAYSVSHDLRAPLRHIDGFARVLLEDYPDKLDDQGKQYLQFVGNAAQRMSQLLDGMLALSRVTSYEMHRQQNDLSDIARSVADLLRASQPERQVEFVVADGLFANGDERLLRVVMENLLGNAWKFAANCPVARIKFGVVEKDGKQVYFVRDNGAGFDMAYAAKLFGAFQRLHSEQEFPGTGIGLATVQRIVRRHGGQVWAEAEMGRGATFYFTLG